MGETEAGRLLCSMVGKSWGEGFLKWWSQVRTGGSKPMDPGPSRGNGTSVQDLGQSLFPYSAPSVWEQGGQRGDMTAVFHIES